MMDRRCRLALRNGADARMLAKSIVTFLELLVAETVCEGLVVPVETLLKLRLEGLNLRRAFPDCANADAGALRLIARTSVKLSAASTTVDDFGRVIANPRTSLVNVVQAAAHDTASRPHPISGIVVRPGIRTFRSESHTSIAILRILRGDVIHKRKLRSRHGEMQSRSLHNHNGTSLQARPAPALLLQRKRTDIPSVIDRTNSVVLHALCVRDQYFFVRAGRLRYCADHCRRCVAGKSVVRPKLEGRTGQIEQLGYAGSGLQGSTRAGAIDPLRRQRHGRSSSAWQSR